MPELYDYQKEQIEKSKSRWFFQMGMGTGKTFTALGHFKYWNKANRPHLVIVAPKTVEQSGDWSDACEAFGVDDFEVWRTDEVKKKTPRTKRYWLIVDEAHKFKSYKSQRGLALRNLANGALGYAMLSGTFANGNFIQSDTGYTLAGGKWEDMANFAIMTGLVKNITFFRNIYGYPIVTRWSNYPTYEYDAVVPALGKWWERVSSDVIHIDDVQELPDVQDFTVTLPKTRWRKADVPIFESNSEKRVWERINSATKAKSDWLKEFLDDTNAGVVVFYNFNEELSAILGVVEGFEAKQMYLVNGNANTLSELNEWRNSVVLVQVKAGGSGLNLQGATHAIWWSLPDSFTDYEQSRYRVYRSGQTKKTTRTELIAGIDHQIKQALDNKKDWRE